MTPIKGMKGIFPHISLPLPDFLTKCTACNIKFNTFSRHMCRFNTHETKRPV